MAPQSPSTRRHKLFDGLCARFAAAKFEADASAELQRSLPDFIRGAEGSLCDAAIVVPESVRNDKIKADLFKFFGSHPEERPSQDMTERICKLYDLTHDSPDEFLIGVDFKHLDMTIPKFIAQGGYSWTIKLQSIQRDKCAAVICGFSALPNWWALVPVEKLPSAKSAIGPGGDEEFTYTWHQPPSKKQADALRNMRDFVVGAVPEWRNPWTGVDYRCRKRHFSSFEILMPHDEPGFRLFSWLRNEFRRQQASGYTFELPKYAPLTSDVKLSKIGSGAITNKQSVLIEIKQNGHCRIKELHQDSFTFKHCTFFGQGQMSRRLPIFSHRGGRWTWLLTIPERCRGPWTPPQRFVFAHRDQLPQQWWDADALDKDWLSGELDRKFLITRDTLWTQMESLLNDRDHEFLLPSPHFDAVIPQGEIAIARLPAEGAGDETAVVVEPEDAGAAAEEVPQEGYIGEGDIAEMVQGETPATNDHPFASNLQSDFASLHRTGQVRSDVEDQALLDRFLTGIFSLYGETHLSAVVEFARSVRR